MTSRPINILLLMLKLSIVSGMRGTSEHTCRKHSLIGAIGSKWLHVAKRLQMQDRCAAIIVVAINKH